MLRIVPPSEPSPKEQVLRRVRAMDNPLSVLQCNRCGCRTMVTVTSGATLVKGRVKGTVIERHVCAECWRRGIVVPMLPELPKRVK